MRKQELIDITPSDFRGHGGSLEYGRYLGNRPSRGDYPAERDKEGIPTNQPICKLILTTPRDEKLWKKSSRSIPQKNIVNDFGFQNTVLKIVVRSLSKGNLKFNLSSLIIGKDRLAT